ncbi:MAG: ATP-binding protein [Candidatus Aenigmatarchaeota archaeon]
MIKERKIFKKLLSENKKHKISIILGPRQVGKTTTLKFLYDNIVVKGKQPGLFLDLDIYSNFEKISTYENALATFKLAGYNPNDKKIFYVFLDEFQRYKDISLILKNIYDHHQNIKIYATGSSSLAIKQKIQESLAGRKIVTHLYPLDFEEFLQFKMKKEMIQKLKNLPLLKGDDLFKVTKELYFLLEEFIIFGGYPEVILTDNRAEKIEILKSIFDLYVKKELVEYLKIEKILETKRLIQYLAVNNANKIKYQEISKTVSFSEKTIKNYIELLKETYLVFELRPFFTNKNKELVKIPKIYFLDTGVSNFFINNFNGFDFRKDAGFLFENYILLELIKNGIEPQKIKFWQDKNQVEVDFVIEESGFLVAIEVKFKQLLNRDAFSGLNIFLKEYPLAKCFLINLSVQKKINNINTLLPYRFYPLIFK